MELYKGWLPVAICCLSLPLIHAGVLLMPGAVNDVGQWLDTLGLMQYINRALPTPLIYVVIVGLMIVPYLLAIAAICFLVWFKLRKARQTSMRAGMSSEP